MRLVVKGSFVLSKLELLPALVCVVRCTEAGAYNVYKIC